MSSLSRTRLASGVMRVVEITLRRTCGMLNLEKSKGVDDLSTGALESCPFFDEPAPFFGAILKIFGEKVKKVVGKSILRVIKVLQELIGRVFIEGRRTVPDVSVTYGILHRWMRFIRSTARILPLSSFLRN